MAAIVALSDLRLVRPLLGVPPGWLREMLCAQGIGWVEDPSNFNPAAGRTRVRQFLADPGGEGEGVAGLLGCTSAAGVARRESEMALARRLAARVSIFPQGYAVISPGPIEPELLSAVVRGLTGAVYPERGAALARLACGAAAGHVGRPAFHACGAAWTGDACGARGGCAAGSHCGQCRLPLGWPFSPGVCRGIAGRNADRGPGRRCGVVSGARGLRRSNLADIAGVAAGGRGRCRAAFGLF